MTIYFHQFSEGLDFTNNCSFLIPPKQRVTAVCACVCLCHTQCGTPNGGYRPQELAVGPPPARIVHYCPRGSVHRDELIARAGAGLRLVAPFRLAQLLQNLTAHIDVAPRAHNP